MHNALGHFVRVSFSWLYISRSNYLNYDNYYTVPSSVNEWRAIALARTHTRQFSFRRAKLYMTS